MLAYGEWSDGEVDLFRKLLAPGDVVVEAGANAGYHTVPIARAVGVDGTVIAVEPQRLVFQTLCANVALNGLRNVRAVQVALGDHLGQIDVPQLEPTVNQAMGGLSLVEGMGDFYLREESLVEAVQMRRIDVWGLDRLALIKADVEGMEPAVLRGARETIERTKPAVYVEADRDEATRALYDVLEGLGYRGWWHCPLLFNPRNFARNETNIFPDVASMNMLWLPQERRAEGDALFPGQAVASGETWIEAARRMGLYKEVNA